jgi:hypothetical protein
MRTRPPCVTALLAGMLWYGSTLAAETDVELGRRVYDREGCAMCHSIQGKGGRYALDGIRGRLSKEHIRKWIVSPREMKPDVKKKSYRLPEQELEALIEYLLGLEQ